MNKQATETKPVNEKTGAIAKLKAYREANTGNKEFTLPKTGVIVSFPAFMQHSHLQTCMRLAKQNMVKAQVIYVCKYCTFDGERLTVTDFETYVSADDAGAAVHRTFRHRRGR